jgi:hypothetical protein
MLIAALVETYLPGRIIDLTGERINSIYNMIGSKGMSWFLYLTHALLGCLKSIKGTSY